jgi:hypothetical protein
MPAGTITQGLWPRLLVAAALLLTWLVPGVRLTDLPEARAQAAAANELMCLSSRAATLQQAAPLDDVNTLRPVQRPTLADVAAPMQRAFDRQWRTDVTRVAFVALAALVLLAAPRRFGGAGPLLVIAAASLYLWAYEPHWDGYRLLWVTQSLALWWHAVSQWSWALQAERLLAPPAVWATLFGACWLLVRAEASRPRRAAPPAQRAPMRSFS